MKETNFKHTDIGLIPQDWELKTLGEIGSFSKGSGISRTDAATGDIPAVRYGELYTIHDNLIKEFGSHISKQVATTAKKLTKGDIVFTCSGETKEDIGKSAAFLYDCEAYAGGDLIILSPDKDYSPEYLGFTTNSKECKEQKAARGQGDAVVHISAREISTIQIPLPPTIDEQKRIAEALQNIDSLIEALDEQIAKKQAIKTGAMQQLLTAKTRLQGFTGEWKEIVLSKIATITIGEFVHKNKQNPNGLYPVYNGGITETGYYDDFNNTANKIVISARGAAGYINKVERPYWAGNSSYSVGIINKEFDWIYIYYFMKSKQETLTENRQQGGGVPAVNKNQITDFVIFCPPTLAEQRAIAEVLSNMDAEIQAMQEERNKYALIKQGMMQELLTGKIRI